MQEVWKPIKDYEGLYEVSNCGNIKSVKNNIILKTGCQTNGYRFVVLYKNGKATNYRVHRLVATAFISNPNNCTDVNHIDENKDNNNVNNLQWVTHKENCSHGSRNKKLTRSIYCHQTNTLYGSIKEAAQTLNVHASAVSMVLSGKRKHTGGYTFEYCKPQC